MKVTRILEAESPNLPDIKNNCKIIAFLRADIWRRYGGLQNVGRSATDIRKEITASKIYADLPIDGMIRAETIKDVVNDILAYKAAAKDKVRKAIFRLIDNGEERKKLLRLLKQDKWLENNFLHRQMRKHFKHGVSKTNNQFVVRSDKFTTNIVDGKLIITLRIAKKYGKPICLITTSSGKNTCLERSNLRIILKNNVVYIHYTSEKNSGRTAGKNTVGLDKGYTEAFVDSEGEFHGKDFGKVMNDYSKKTSQTGKARNKLHALEKKHRAKGNNAKADRIIAHNLGTKKITKRKELTKKRLRNIAYKAVHAIVDKAKVVVSEDLSAPIVTKKPWKAFNRRMSGWAKGLLAEALNSVTKQRDASHEIVNCAYTSQMDSITGLLQGKRVGDKFYRINGDVMHADVNAAKNVLARLYDREILRYTPFKAVKRILLLRSPAELTVNRLELQP